MQQSPNYSTERAPGREHIPLYPKYFIAVRIIQMLIAIICLGLCAFGFRSLAFAGAAVMIFTAIATFITSIYHLASHYRLPKLFSYWVILVLDIFLVIFWLSSFANVASSVAAVSAVYSVYNKYNKYYDDYFGYLGYSKSAYTCSAAAAGLGGVEFVTYIVSLSIHSVMLHRHRKGGLKSMPGRTPTHGSVAGGGAPAGAEKFQMQPQPQSQQVYDQRMQTAMSSPPQAHIAPQSTSPLSAQPTGNFHVQPQQVMNPDLPAYEVPGQIR
ncbi:hypothetical protein F5B20DRAFT_533313 [Whalleya microplaca]|nr:hypothetical protein F5B20DRAFT_533313 [Whalleya microplaca]